MWGTIARMQVKPDVPQAYLEGQFRAINTKRMSGWLSTSFFRSDANPHEVWMVAMFESKESYRANSATPAQHALYQTLRACLEADPEWHDVEEAITIGR